MMIAIPELGLKIRLTEAANPCEADIDLSENTELLKILAQKTDFPITSVILTHWDEEVFLIVELKIPAMLDLYTEDCVVFPAVISG